MQGGLKPLTNGLPFELTGDWVQLPLPASLAGLSVEKGKLDLRGSLRTYQLKLESNGKWLDFPSTHLQLALSGTTEKLDLQRLQFGDGVNQLIVAGQLSWQKDCTGRAVRIAITGGKSLVTGHQSECCWWTKTEIALAG